MLHRLRMIAVVVLALLVLMPTPAAWAQGCVLCYTSLSNASPRGLHLFQVALLVLLTPALLLFIGLFLLIYHHRTTAEADVWPASEASVLDDPDLSPLA
jgi:hypothetical protein